MIGGVTLFFALHLVVDAGFWSIQIQFIYLISLLTNGFPELKEIPVVDASELNLFRFFSNMYKEVIR
jgi:hypothetical protein